MCESKSSSCSYAHLRQSIDTSRRAAPPRRTAPRTNQPTNQPTNVNRGERQQRPSGQRAVSLSLSSSSSSPRFRLTTSNLQPSIFLRYIIIAYALIDIQPLTKIKSNVAIFKLFFKNVHAQSSRVVNFRKIN